MQLLNIVKFRYFDTPVFVDVTSVVSQQELYGQANFTSRLVPNPLTTSTRDYDELQAQGRYTDRPTISYTPITGDRFINTLLRPIPPATIFEMINAGHDAGFILSLAVRSIDGVYDYSLAPGRGRPEDPRFPRLTAAIRRIQQGEAIATRTAQTGKQAETLVVFRHSADPAVEQDIRLVKNLLGLEPGAGRVRAHWRPNP